MHLGPKVCLRNAVLDRQEGSTQAHNTLRPKLVYCDVMVRRHAISLVAIVVNKYYNVYCCILDITESVINRRRR